MIVRASAMRHALTIFVKRGREREKEGRKGDREGGRNRANDTTRGGGGLFQKSRCIFCFQTRRLIIISLSIRYQGCDRRLRCDPLFSTFARACINACAVEMREYRSRDVRASGRGFSFPVLFPDRVRLISDARIIRNRWI